MAWLRPRHGTHGDSFQYNDWIQPLPRSGHFGGGTKDMAQPSKSLSLLLTVDRGPYFQGGASYPDVIGGLKVGLQMSFAKCSDDHQLIDRQHGWLRQAERFKDMALERFVVRGFGA